MSNKVAILEQVYELIETGKNTYICYALTCLKENGQADPFLCDELKKEIEDYLYPYATLGNWYIYNVSLYYSNFKQIRLNFLASWIERLEEKEKGFPSIQYIIQQSYESPSKAFLGARLAECCRVIDENRPATWALSIHTLMAYMGY